MQTRIKSTPAAMPDGRATSVFVAKSDVTALARLLDHAGTTLHVNPAGAGGFLARANVMLASMLEASAERPKYEPAEGGMAPWQMRRVQAEIEANLHEALPVRQLAACTRLSCSHFSRTFKLTFGCSPHAYIMQRRIERAKALIRDNTGPLAQVALACGLADQAHLSRIFRRHVGCTPSRWRREARV